MTLILKEGESTSPVDPVVIEWGSGHKAFAMPVSNAASTSNGFGENIVEKDTATEVGPVVDLWAGLVHKIGRL